MYTGFLHLHVFTVNLFLAYYLVKTVLLLANKTQTLDKITKWLRIPHIIIASLFLITGIYLATQAPSVKVGYWFWVKLIATAALIPVGIVAFKNRNKIMASTMLLLLLYTYGVSETKSPRMVKQDYYAHLGDQQTIEPTNANTDINSNEYNIQAHGKRIYQQNCSICHGNDGKLMAGGAKNLAISKLDKNGITNIINKGKNSMPKFKGILKTDEIDAVVAYTMLAIHNK